MDTVINKKIKGFFFSIFIIMVCALLSPMCPASAEETPPPVTEETLPPIVDEILPPAEDDALPLATEEIAPPAQEEITGQTDAIGQEDAASSSDAEANVAELSTIGLIIKIPMAIELQQDGDSATGTYEIFIKGGSLQPNEAVTITLLSKGIDFENISDETIDPIRGTITQSRTIVYAEEISDEYPSSGQISGTISVTGLTTGDWKSHAVFELSVEGPSQETPADSDEPPVPEDGTVSPEPSENQNASNQDSSMEGKPDITEPVAPEPTPSEPTVPEIPPESEVPEPGPTLPATPEPTAPEATEPVVTEPPIEENTEIPIDSPSSEGAVLIFRLASAILYCTKYVF